MEVAMDGLSHYRRANEDVICDALARWCEHNRCEPDAMLMNRALALFDRGYDTPDRLFQALQKDLLN
jgi:hypothetical protein